MNASAKLQRFKMMVRGIATDIGVLASDQPDSLSGVSGMFQLYNPQTVMYRGAWSGNYLKGWMVLVLPNMVDASGSPILDNYGHVITPGLYGASIDIVGVRPQFPETQQWTEQNVHPWHFLCYYPQDFGSCGGSFWLNASTPA